MSTFANNTKFNCVGAFVLKIYVKSRVGRTQPCVDCTLHSNGVGRVAAMSVSIIFKF